MFLDYWDKYPPNEKDLWIYLRPTTPFRCKDMILKAIKIMTSGLNYHSLRSIEAMSESAFKAFTIQSRASRSLVPCFGTFDMANQPDQRNKPTFKGNGYVDIVRGVQYKTGELWGKRCYGMLTPAVIELDTPEDWQRAEDWLELQEYRRKSQTYIEKQDNSLHNTPYRTSDGEKTIITPSYEESGIISEEKWNEMNGWIDGL